MGILFFIFINSIINTNSIIPTWNIKTSTIDLLDSESSHTYTIDHRNRFFYSSDYLTKTIKRENGKIIHENTFKLYDIGWNNEKFIGTVKFESIDSFYGDTNEQTDVPLVCPKGNFYPFKIISKSEMREIKYSNTEWIKNENSQLKCFFHRSYNGHFLTYYLMNENNYLLELISPYYSDEKRYYFDIDELYDFKLLNKEDFQCDESNPYPFIGLVKKDDNLRLIGTGLIFHEDSQTIQDYIDLLKIQKHTRAFFNVYDYNNDFYYFTYNNIYDFTSGYSTKSIPTTDNPNYSDIGKITFFNNENSPFEFLNDVEILQMEIIFNYKYVYYKIKDKTNNKIYYGILDIQLNKIMFNTDEEIEEFIPYITFIETEKGGYQHSNSMLMITKDSAYRVCAIKDNYDCLDQCPSGQKILFDVDGNKCVSIDKQCDPGKLLLIPEEVCIKECDNETLYVNNETHCGLCRDMDPENKYKFIHGNKCLNETPEGAIFYNENFSLLVCDEGYTLRNNTCDRLCYTTCKTCFNKSDDPNNQQCIECIDGYFLVDNITYNCEPIPKTTIPNIPSTITIIPTTMPLIQTTIEIIDNIPTTIPIIQTSIAFIPTTIPIIPTTDLITFTTIFTTIPTTTITTIPKIIQTTLPIIIPSTIEEKIYNNCTYQYYLNYKCSFENLNNSEILSKIKNEMLKTYPNNGINIEIKGSDGYAFQLSNSLNQLDNKYSSFSKINLNQCEINIKQNYSLEPNISLIFIKFENIESSKNERKIQYEVYNPINYEQLNISICQNTKIQIIFSVELSNELKKMIENILKQEYDLFDENGKFYKDICTPFNSENGNDILLEDRRNYIYRSIIKEISCPSGCKMIFYSLNEKYIICECDINNSGIIGQDYHHSKEKEDENSFLTIFKYSFHKVIPCYNLVFDFNIFFHNYISIISLIFFSVYIVMLYFSIRSIFSFFKNLKKLNNINSNDINTRRKSKRHSRREKESYPPKKRHSTTRRDKQKKLNKRTKENLLKIMEIDEENIKDMETIPNHRDKKKLNSYRERKKMAALENNIDMYLKTKEKLMSQKGILEFNEDFSSQESQENQENQESQENQENIVDLKEKNFIEAPHLSKHKHFNDFELNNMSYREAFENDKRNCIKIYWSLLKRENYFILTFYTRNDHNLFYIKFQRFLFLICTEITMNGMFFIHETMYINQNGGLNFVNKIPQIIFSLLISHVIEIFLCYLSMTDKAYYSIKTLSIKEKNNEKINAILECVKIKLIGFFIFTFSFFIFYSYYISAFCSVYQNTQLIYLRDSAICILISLIDPFIFYGIICLLRVLSLSKRCKKKQCIYKMSHIFPLF